MPVPAFRSAILCLIDLFYFIIIIITSFFLLLLLSTFLRFCLAHMGVVLRGGRRLRRLRRRGGALQLSVEWCFQLSFNFLKGKLSLNLSFGDLYKPAEKENGYLSRSGDLLAPDKEHVISARITCDVDRNPGEAHRPCFVVDKTSDVICSLLWWSVSLAA